MTMSSKAAEIDQFLERAKAAFEAGSLLKCVLSKPTGTQPADLKGIQIRCVQLKRGTHWAFNHRYRTRDEVKNFAPAEGLEKLRQCLEHDWAQAELFTTEYDCLLHMDRADKAKSSLRKPTATAPANTRHDRAKPRLLDPAAPWLHALGICNAKGEVLPTSQDKWKQMNRYLETLEGLLRHWPAGQRLDIADMGSGKGYLTFALYDMLRHHLSLQPRITGIELRQPLVDFCNQTAQASGFSDLHFVAQDIAAYQPAQLDVLIALHACDTATDLALAAGIRLDAPLIVVAPCCHKQIRREMKPHNELSPILQHGILAERQAEMLTDGIRALLLESRGWQTRVFEFISTEHTAKNVMITAQKGRGTSATAAHRTQSLAQVAALKQSFGIREHYLEGLLGVEGG